MIRLILAYLESPHRLTIHPFIYHTLRALQPIPRPVLRNLHQRSAPITPILHHLLHRHRHLLRRRAHVIRIRELIIHMFCRFARPQRRGNHARKNTHDLHILIRISLRHGLREPDNGMLRRAVQRRGIRSRDPRAGGDDEHDALLVNGQQAPHRDPRQFDRVFGIDAHGRIAVRLGVVEEGTPFWLEDARAGDPDLGYGVVAEGVGDGGRDGFQVRPIGDVAFHEGHFVGRGVDEGFGIRREAEVRDEDFGAVLEDEFDEGEADAWVLSVFVSEWTCRLVVPLPPPVTTATLPSTGKSPTTILTQGGREVGNFETYMLLF